MPQLALFESPAPPAPDPDSPPEPPRDLAGEDLPEGYDAELKDHKESDADLWRLWELYNELDRAPTWRVPALRSAIAYLGGSLKVRHPVPKRLRNEIDGYIPVR